MSDCQVGALPSDAAGASGLRILARIIARIHIEGNYIQSLEREAYSGGSLAPGEVDDELWHGTRNEARSSKNGH